MSIDSESGIYYKHLYYPESRFGSFTDVDDTIVFYNRVNSLINFSSIILDIGCGRGAYAEDPVSIRRELRIFRGKCKKIIGIDVDSNARENPVLDAFHLIGSNSHWPLKDESVDVALSDWVLEHVEDPWLFFSECRRVIRQGGYLCIRTTNIFSYYGSVARLIPNRFRTVIIRRVFADPGKEEDIFPTFYRCNTVGKLRGMLNELGFEHCVYGYQAEPSHFSFSRLFYFMGVVHQRFAPNVLKPAIFAFARKKVTDA